MNPVEIFVRHDAELDAFGYFRYLHDYDAEAAYRFLKAIDFTVAGLALQPFKGRLRRFRGKNLGIIRSWRVNDFEHYLIFYRFKGVRLEILRIKHGSMNFPQAIKSS